MNKSHLCYCFFTLQYVSAKYVAGYLLVIIIIIRVAPIIYRSIVYRFIGLLFRYRYQSSTLPAVPI